MIGLIKALDCGVLLELNATISAVYAVVVVSLDLHRSPAPALSDAVKLGFRDWRHNRWPESFSGVKSLYHYTWHSSRVFSSIFLTQPSGR